VRRLVNRHHLRGGPTRGEREAHALRLVRTLGVRAPEPVAWAARGLVCYRGWLLTRYVPNRGDLRALAPHAPARRVSDAVAATAEQVALLMAHRVLHVDLHPGNVILDDHGLPWLLDFDRAMVFNGPFDQLRARYVARWQRFVRKNQLPDVVSDAFASELYRLTRLEVESLLGPIPAAW
jgi:RIO-like serine/threonine protein kinase